MLLDSEYIASHSPNLKYILITWGIIKTNLKTSSSFHENFFCHRRTRTILMETRAKIICWCDEINPKSSRTNGRLGIRLPRCRGP